MLMAEPQQATGPQTTVFLPRRVSIESHQLFTLQIISISTYHVLGTSEVKVKVTQSCQTLRPHGL